MATITYKKQTASAEEIYFHLKKCNDNFIPPLEKKVNLLDYSKKIADKSVTFEAWDESSLAGLIAAYLNDSETKKGFITNVTTVKEYQGKGIASQLMKMCIDYSRNSLIKVIALEVAVGNADAIQLYKKNGFKEVEVKNGMLVMKIELN